MIILIMVWWAPKIESGLSVLTVHHRRLFPNVSLGLGVDGMMHQCDAKGYRTSSVIHDKNLMGYTPNRRLQNETTHEADLEQLQLVFYLKV